MGRRPWATPEQTEYLESFTLKLEQEKKGNGLKQYYDAIASKFLAKWPAVPTTEELKGSSDVLDAQNTANRRRTAQIHEWFKAFRKRDQTSHSKAVLDLTGKNSRKPQAHQPHHAYSVRFYQPEDSPLRQEVEDLWKRRKEKSVIDLLEPFMHTDGPSGTRLEFHNAVMRWKCSLLTDEESQEHQDWINKTQLMKEAEMSQPWKAIRTATGNENLAVENEFIQGSIDALPATINLALAQIERATGMKAIILIGGPSPVEQGDFHVHYYETGRSRDTDLSFTQSSSGFEAFHEEFVGWLRTVYSEEEISRRSGGLTPSTQGTPTRTTATDTPVAANPAAVVPSAPLTSPSPPSQPPPQQEPSPNPTPQRAHNELLNDPEPEQQPTTPESDVVNEPPQRFSPGPRTIELANDPNQTMDEQDLPPDESARFMRSSSPPGTFFFGGSAPFISSAIEYLHTVPAGPHWSDMVNCFLRLEELPPVNGSPLRLSTRSRPSEVARWMKHKSYTQDHLPYVSDVPSYRRNWITWWTSCQPAWRRAEWPLPRDKEGTEWVKIGARGQYGFFLVVLATTWWAYSIRSEEEWVGFDEAVEDMEWVFGQVSGSLKTLQASTPPVQPAPPAQPALPENPQKPNSTASWMTRDAGKRQPKPSRKLKEGGGI